MRHRQPVWVAYQRVPLAQIPAFRMLQGLALIAAAFLGLSWIIGRIRIIFFARLPFTFFIFILAILGIIAYLGYLRLTGGTPFWDDSDEGKTSNLGTPRDSGDDDIERELSYLGRQTKPNQPNREQANQKEAEIEKELAQLRRQNNLNFQKRRLELNLKTLVLPLIIIAFALGIWGLTLWVTSEQLEKIPSPPTETKSGLDRPSFRRNLEFRMQNVEIN